MQHNGRTTSSLNHSQFLARIEQLRQCHAQFDDPSLARKPKDLENLIPVVGDGYIVVTPKVVWRPAEERRIIHFICEGAPAADRLPFDIVFSGPWVNVLPFAIKKQYKILLKGATSERRAPQSRTALSLRLRYSDGVVVSNIDNGQGVLDTWIAQEEREYQEKRENGMVGGDMPGMPGTPLADDAWFLTPPTVDNTTAKSSTTEVVEDNISQKLESLGIRHSPMTGIIHDTVNNNPRKPNFVIQSNGRGDTSSMFPPHSSETTQLQEAVSNDTPTSNAAAPVTKMTGKQRKQKRKAEKALAAEASAKKARVEQSSRPGTSKHPTSLPISVGATATPSTNLTAPAPESRVIIIESSLPSGGVYTPLRKANPSVDQTSVDVTRLYNFVAVLTEDAIFKTTRTQEHSCSLRITDQSLTNDNITESFTVTLFTKHHAEWLPYAKKGDVIILRNIKVAKNDKSSISHYTGVGYHDRAQWAIYDMVLGAAQRPQLGGKPESEGLANGAGFSFTPFYKPADFDLGLCASLAKWQKDRDERASQPGQTMQIRAVASGKRQHRLLTDAGPDVEPYGFFDCTVEILFTHENDYDNPFTIYATDYTPCQGTAPVKAQWCPLGMSEHVVKFEVWDEARAFARTMCRGEYYSIGNARMVRSKGGFVEGKIKELKMQRLQQQDASVDLPLRNLIERKQAFANAAATAPATYPYKLIADIQSDEYFTCVVEVIQTVFLPNKANRVFVTDYTRNSRLRYAGKETWSQGLDGCIVTIFVPDVQVETVKAIAPGSFCRLEAFRLKDSAAHNACVAYLSEHQPQIFPLMAQDSNTELLKLQLRKQQWQQNRVATSTETSYTTREITPAFDIARSKLGRKRTSQTIKEIQASSTIPGYHRVIARIVDIHPMDLEDRFYMYCEECHKDIPKNMRACGECTDMTRENVRYKFQFYIVLKDEAGEWFVVSVHDKCAFLDGLERADLRDNRRAREALRRRLEPVIGNLVEVHRQLKANIDVAVDSPLLSCVIQSWKHVQNQDNAYCLIRFETDADEVAI